MHPHPDDPSKTRLFYSIKLKTALPTFIVKFMQEQAVTVTIAWVKVGELWSGLLSGERRYNVNSILRSTNSYARIATAATAATVTATATITAPPSPPPRSSRARSCRRRPDPLGRRSGTMPHRRWSIQCSPP